MPWSCGVGPPQGHAEGGGGEEKAGHNAEAHNHNDIGSFILVKNDRTLLVAPGTPIYTKKTFSAQRYTILHTRSRGHSVPVIKGEEQLPGPQYRGTLTTEGLGDAPAKATKRAIIEMAHAYRRGLLEKLTRTIEVTNGQVTIEDLFIFPKKPRVLEEAFITFEDAKVAPNGRTVHIGGKTGLTLEAQTPGRFKVDRLETESRQAPSEDIITRITFTPATLAPQMQTRFLLR